jgi:hypothetical protein
MVLVKRPQLLIQPLTKLELRGRPVKVLLRHGRQVIALVILLLLATILLPAQPPHTILTTVLQLAITQVDQHLTVRPQRGRQLRRQ